MKIKNINFLNYLKKKNIYIICSAWYNGSTSRCGRDDPGSIPGADIK